MKEASFIDFIVTMLWVIVGILVAMVGCLLVINPANFGIGIFMIMIGSIMFCMNFEKSTDMMF